ncbi:MAG: hypothetical protein ACRELE_10090, partial [Gemmatimonadales bacterium]
TVRTLAIAANVNSAERLKGPARRASLEKLAPQLDRDVAGASDPARVKWLAAAVRDLARATH